MSEAQWVALGQDGKEPLLQASSTAELLLLSGEPIDEPVVGVGPFVMNSHREIRKAIHDFNEGTFGVLSGDLRQR